MYVSRNSEVYVHECFLMQALPIVHMRLWPDHESQEQRRYSNRALDHFLHARGLYQNNWP